MSPPNYQTRAVRDLYWALTTPSLFDSPRAVMASEYRPDIDRYQGLFQQLDRRRSSLQQALRRAGSPGPGEYFEILLHQWLKALPPATVHATNWQVYHGGHTLGEFDLIFERDRKLWHWEMALKLYLGHPAKDGQFRWYGPRPQDRLDHKWAHLRGHQLRLHQHPAARDALQSLELDDTPHSRAFIKGYLFEPLAPRFELDYPPDINPAAPRGWWAHQGEISRFRRPLGAANRRWMPLPVHRWLAPAHRDDEPLQNFDALCAQATHRPLLVAGFDDGSPIEATRGFIVPDGWPHDL